MSSEDSDSDGKRMRDEEGGAGADQENDSLTSKLSKELSNWRRRRTTSRSHRADSGGGGNAKSEPARTIKVRGHETLVVRKPKLGPKPPANPEPGEG